MKLTPGAGAGFARSVVVLALAAAVPAYPSALTIKATFDSSLAANLSAADVTNVQNAFNYAAGLFTSQFNDPIQINITVSAVAGTGTLGQSVTQLAGYFSYGTIRNALIADQKSTDDASAVGTLPVAAPTDGHLYATSRAEAKALSLIPSDSLKDGTFIFGAGYSYTFDPAHRAVPGEYDFIGVAAHEISEIMGRIRGLGANFGDGGPDYLPFDLFRYSAAGTRSLTGGNNNYFSIDNGVTNLKSFNSAPIFGGDPQDWASGANDSFNAFSNTGVQNDLTAVDLRALDVIGYDSTVPEPATVTVMAFAGLAMLAVARRRRQ